MRWIFLFFFSCLPLASQVAPSETSSTLYLEARTLFQEGRYSEALEIIQRSLAKAPADAEPYKLAALCAIRMDRLDIAEPALQTAAQLAPRDFLVHFHLGALYYTRSLFLLAKPELEKAAELNPGYMPAFLFLGLTLEEVGDEKTTIVTYQKAIALAATGHPGRETPYIYLGRYYYRLNRFDQSLALLEKAVTTNPGSGEAQLELGKALHALKRDSEAVAALERSAAVDAQNPEPHYLLYRIYESAGQEQAAKKELKRFQELNSQKQALDPARRRLQSASAQ